ncbi:hypothetical protein [Mesonia sp. K4-1]|uniref:hypothetical protein n=1 Tax=Mesonia sp. K4-1 TaxID=2602760 RepID=UPI0011C82AF1|nr:hypothetical protein [Mesonia sp. K4-1]TXK78704.1 hypothetical protein FT986_02605 [Mesonia sp. K4-1]
MASLKYQVLIEMRDNIIDYLEKEKGINEDALKAYEDGPIKDSTEEIKVMRERERIKLRDRIFELKRHIEVIKRMYPNE